MKQMELFAAVQDAYAESSTMSNAELYRAVARRTSLASSDVEEKRSVGKSGQKHSIFKRQCRWVQQTLKHLGLLKRIRRSEWSLTAAGRKKLQQVERPFRVLAFSTRLGIAVLGDCRDVFSEHVDIHLVVTSPMYPIAKGRRYGAIKEHEYVDWLMDALAPVVECLVPGGSLCINLGVNVFKQGSPERSLYPERVTLALAANGLHLMDRLIWNNVSAPPGPVQWSSLKRYHLTGTYELVLWFTNSPEHLRADNRRILQPHSERHKHLLENQSPRPVRATADGAHRSRPTSFTTKPPGRIPRNVLSISHTCASQKRYKQLCRDHGITPHGAVFPAALPAFLIQWLTQEGDTVADPMAGSHTVPEVCEDLGRHWVASEVVPEYVRGGALRLTGRPGFTDYT